MGIYSQIECWATLEGQIPTDRGVHIVFNNCMCACVCACLCVCECVCVCVFVMPKALQNLHPGQRPSCLDLRGVLGSGALRVRGTQGSLVEKLTKT